MKSHIKTAKMKLSLHKFSFVKATVSFFLPDGRQGKVGSAVRGTKKHLFGKVPCQPGLHLDTVLSIFSVTYPYLRGKSRTVPILCGIVPISCQTFC